MSLMSDGFEFLGMFTAIIIISLIIAFILNDHFNHGYINGELVKCVEWQEIVNPTKQDYFFSSNPHSCSKWEKVTTLPIRQGE